MRNIIISGPSRAGKSTLARLLGEALGLFVINEDKLVAVFQEAYPRLDIRLNWDRDKTTDNLSPFLAHFLGVFSASDGRGMLPYSHGAAGNNRFVLEGGYFNFDLIAPVLKAYGIDALKDKFMLIGLAQNHKTIDELMSDFRKYDTEYDWTYNLGESDLRRVCEDNISFSLRMSEHLTKHGFTIYDTSQNRAQVLKRIVDDVKAMT